MSLEGVLAQYRPALASLRKPLYARSAAKEIDT